jgi:ankyrin repeat protein
MNSFQQKVIVRLTKKIYQHPYVLFLVLGLLIAITVNFISYDLEERDLRGRTPLYLASEQGRLEEVIRLIKKGAIIDARDDCLWTPFMRAAQNGHIEVVKQLLNAGANINTVDKEGYNALIATVITNQVQMLNYLVENGINLNVQDNVMGWTALMWAIKEGRSEIVAILLENSADKSIKDYSGKTAYDWAMEMNQSYIAEEL